MTVRPIVTVGHPVLRGRAREVEPDELASPAVQAVIDDLIDTMRAADGAGLAANQVHRAGAVRIAAIEVDHNPRYPYKPPIPLTVVVNPVIEPLDDELVEINEGCLSVPDLRGDVVRHVNVRLRYLDRDGVAHDEVKRGLTAGTFQHELDHLDGVLFLDRVQDPTTLTTWAQFERFHRAAFVRAHHRLRGPGRIVTRRGDELLVRVGLAGRRRRPRRRGARGGGRPARVGHRGPPRPPGAVRLAGLTLPGLVNGHSHAFHRALRGRTQAGSGSFWTWREQMYALAARLDPDRVPPPGPGHVRRDGPGRHHHRRRVPLPAPRTDGRRYDEANAMGEALVAAAPGGGRAADPDRHLLPARRHRRGRDAELTAGQLRFSDGIGRGVGRTGGGPGHAAGPGRAGAAGRRGAQRPGRHPRRDRGGGGRGPGQRLAPACPRERAAGRERGLPGRLRPHPHAGPGRRRRPRPRLHRRPRRPPDRRRHRRPGRRGRCALCPTTERDLADGVAPASELVAAGATLGPGHGLPRGDRPVRGGPGGRARRAPGHRPSRSPPGQRAAGGGHRRRGPIPGLVRRRSPGGGDAWPTSSP